MKKTALCEKVEDIVKDEHKGANEWEKLTKEIIDIQAEWKKIGFAPQEDETSKYSNVSVLHATISSQRRLHSLRK